MAHQTFGVVCLGAKINPLEMEKIRRLLVDTLFAVTRQLFKNKNYRRSENLFFYKIFLFSMKYKKTALNDTLLKLYNISLQYQSVINEHE